MEKIKGWRNQYDKDFDDVGRVIVFEKFIQGIGFGFTPAHAKEHIKEKEERYNKEIAAMKEAFELWKQEFKS